MIQPNKVQKLNTYEFLIEYQVTPWGNKESHWPKVKAKTIEEAKKKIESVLEPGFIIVDVREKNEKEIN